MEEEKIGLSPQAKKAVLASLRSQEAELKRQLDSIRNGIASVESLPTHGSERAVALFPTKTIKPKQGPNAVAGGEELGKDDKEGLEKLLRDREEIKTGILLVYEKNPGGWFNARAAARAILREKGLRANERQINKLSYHARNFLETDEFESRSVDFRGMKILEYRKKS
jgi:hypothetical protein